MKSTFSLVMMAGVGFVVTLTGCVGYVEGPPVGHVYVQPVILEHDDFVYYPRYGVYYGSISHQYYYQEGPTWVARPAPRGVSVNVLLSAPSVGVGFHDGPAAHHAQVTQSYPKSWTPPGGNQGRKEGWRGNHKDEREGREGNRKDEREGRGGKHKDEKEGREGNRKD